MKLELKHLAPYLPYGLKGLAHEGHVIEGVRTLKGLSFNKELVFRVDYYKQTEQIYKFKPILYPLSDLNKERVVDGESFSPNLKTFEILGGQFLDTVLEEDADLLKLPYTLITLLFEWHFDVFNLIDQNLAIDVNTLEVNPYE